MAIYHLHVKYISRGAKKSVVSAVAYRAGEKHTALEASAYRSGDELAAYRNGTTYDYRRKTGVLHKEIMLPENAPREYGNRSVLWNTVELSETRINSRTAREVEMALPVEFDLKEQIEILRAYIQENFVDKGMCADFAIHDKEDGNPHAHVMLTTREVSKEGFGKKNRGWDKVECLLVWRKNWADICNYKFREKGLDTRIDHRTLAAQGIDREPTIHEGRNPERIKRNQEIKRRNKIREERKKPEFIAKRINELGDKFVIADKKITQLSEKNREAQRLQYRADDMESRLADVQSRRGDSAHIAREGFKRNFRVDAHNAPAEIQRIRAQSAALMKEGANIEEWREARDTIAYEYQKQLSIVKIRPDGVEIFRRVKSPPPQLERLTQEREKVRDIERSR